MKACLMMSDCVFFHSTRADYILQDVNNKFWHRTMSTHPPPIKLGNQDGLFQKWSDIYLIGFCNWICSSPAQPPILYLTFNPNDPIFLLLLALLSDLFFHSSNDGSPWSPANFTLAFVKLRIFFPQSCGSTCVIFFPKGTSILCTVAKLSFVTQFSNSLIWLAIW